MLSIEYLQVKFQKFLLIFECNIFVDSSMFSQQPVEMENPYERPKVRCLLCKYNVKLDYKNVRLLSQFISSFSGNVYDRNVTRLCQAQHDHLVEVIRESRARGEMSNLNPSLYTINLFIFFKYVTVRNCFDIMKKSSRSSSEKV